MKRLSTIRKSIEAILNRAESNDYKLHSIMQEIIESKTIPPEEKTTPEIEPSSDLSCRFIEYMKKQGFLKYKEK